MKRKCLTQSVSSHLRKLLLITSFVLLLVFIVSKTSFSQYEQQPETASAQSQESSIVERGLVEHNPDLLSSQAQGQIQVGAYQFVEERFEYPSEETQVKTFQYPGAMYIKLHFKSMDLLPGHYVTVSNPSGTQVHTYPGSDYTTDALEGFWALSIIGDTAVVILHQSKLPSSEVESSALPVYERATVGAELWELGIVVDKYARGFSREEIETGEEPRLESTCGTNERTDVVCYENTHPTEYDRSSAVTGLLKDGRYWCTAWRVGPDNRMFTNEHCITSQDELNQSEFWFNYQRTVCESGGTDTTTIVSGNDFLDDNYALDYALFTVNSFNTIDNFEFLNLDVRTPQLNEEIYITQHGGGNPKEFGIESDQNDGNVCRIDDAIANGRGANTDTGYRCDTIGGSSGSPVLARASHRVIALHHFGVSSTCPPQVNQGVRMDQIWPNVEDQLSPDADLVSVNGIPQSIQPGSSFTVDVSAGNNGTASAYGAIAVSVLFSDGSDNLTISNVGASWADTVVQHDPGGIPIYDNNCVEISGGAADHSLEAIDNNWLQNENHTLSFTVTPHSEGNLWVRIRSTMEGVGVCDWDNDHSVAGGTTDTDQQGWDVERYAVDVATASDVGPLVYGSHQIDDDNSGGSSGNSDGKADCGETIELNVTLMNEGADLASGVSASLSTNDPYVTVTDSSEDFPDIPGGGSREDSADYDFNLAGNTPDGRNIQFDLNINAANGGPWTDTFSIQASCIPPGPFSKSSPGDGANNQPNDVTLSWETSSGATHYDYCYDDTNDAGCTDWMANGNSTSVHLSGLSKGTTYYWHVRANNGSGTPTYANGSSTSFWSFSTATDPPGHFVKSSPLSGAIDQPLNVTLSWEPSSGATDYDYCYDDTNDASCADWIPNGNSTSVQLGNLLQGTSYYWHVRANNSGGTTYSSGSVDGFWSFVTKEAADILLVDDDDNSPDVRGFYTSALDALGLDYDIWDTTIDGTEPEANYLAAYGIVIWFSGDAFNQSIGIAGPGPAAESALGTWLDSGNCLFLSSQDYYYDRGEIVTPFMSSYLGVESVANDVVYYSVNGTGSVFDGLGPYSLVYPDPDFEYPDLVIPAASAEIAFTAVNDFGGAITKDNGTYRTTYWAFPFEALATEDNRREAMDSVVNWCRARATHEIPLSAGWNMISTYVEPVNPAVSSILSDIVDDFVLIKNGGGDVYWPSNGSDDIGDWDVHHGYQIYMVNAATLKIVGTPVDPVQTPIDLQVGWNLAAYLSDTKKPIDQALVTVDGELYLAKNGAGQVYWPFYGTNQIGDMQPGQGYYLYLTTPATLTYPAD